MTKLVLTAEQVINLRNNMIISEALNEYGSDGQPSDSAVSDDYNKYSVPNIARQPDQEVSSQSKEDSSIYGSIVTKLSDYSHKYGIPEKIATELSKTDARISVPMVNNFIEQLLVGLSRMASQPDENISFERLMLAIGVTTDAQILTKDNTL